MIRFLLKTLLRGLLILALVPLLIGALLASESVNRWLFAQIMKAEPRLELSFVDGQLWRGWRFEQIVWRDEALTVEVNQALLAWSPNCLFGLQLCIDQLEVESIHVASQPDETPSERQDISLPTINLPLGIEISRLYIGSLWLDEQAPLLTDISLISQLSADHLVIRQFSGTGPDLDWRLEGDVRMSGDWPLNVGARANLPKVDERYWNIDARVTGSAAQLDVDLHSRGYLPGRLNGHLEPLKASIPLDLTWQGDSFLALSELPASLTLEELLLTLKGDLDQGIALQADGSLPGEGGKVSLKLAALVALTGVSDLDMALWVAEDNARRLELAGELDWEETLDAKAELSLQRFPWQWLYPQDLGEIELQQLKMRAHLQDMDLDSELTARLTGVAGQGVDLSMSVNGNQEALRIAPLELSTEAGQARGSIDLQLADGVRWAVALLLENLDPGVFVKDLPGQLNGPLNSTGSLIGEDLRLAADWKLEGTLRSQPLEISGDLDKQSEAWEVSSLLIRQGENRIRGQGEWGERIAGSLDIQMPSLNTLWPGLRGNISGQINASGSASAPRLSVNLEGGQIGYDELQLSALEVQGRVDVTEQLPGDLSIAVQRLRNGDTRLGNLDVQLQGNRDRHRLALQIERGIVDLDLQVDGRLLADSWQGQLSNAQIASEEMVWRQLDSAAIRYQMTSGSLRLGAHCWGHEGGRLCFNGEQRLMPDRQVQLALSDFPLASLQPWLPEDFSWEGSLDANVNFNQAVGRDPTARINLSSLNGQVNVENDEQSLNFPYQRLELNSLLETGRATNRFQLNSQDLGKLDVQANIDDPAGQQALSGQYRIEGLKLDFLRPFMPQVETLQGQLNGNGRLAGTLREPDVEGVIVLRDGYVSGPELPISLEQLGVRVRIEGQRAGIEGEWRSGEQGEGTLAGGFSWAPELDFDLALKGSSLPVRVAPYADLQVSPDLTITLADNTLQILGQVAVPEGEISVRELPEQAVQLSPDVVIVGQEVNEEEGIPLAIRARVQLLIGDQLHLSAFGLTGRLSGQIQVEENMNASGDLNILDGRFRGYGQRLSLRRAQILFAGPISQPFLNIEAIRQVNDIVAGLRLTGRAETPQSEVFSEPAMAQEQALSYLILGRPLGGDTGDSNMLGQAALALGLAGSAPVAQNIASALGIEGFQLDTEGSGLSTQVVAAGYITDKLSLRYGVGVFEPANQLGLRYELTKRLYLEAISGFASSLDFFYRIDF